jgi:hypothetical protein
VLLGEECLSEKVKNMWGYFLGLLISYRGGLPLGAIAQGEVVSNMGGIIGGLLKEKGGGSIQ